MTILHPIAARLLDERGITDIESFLNPSYDTRPDPFLMKGMEAAVTRILKAIELKEKVAVWGDYDCDGVPGASLLFHFFDMIQYPVAVYIPERSEGYGLNTGGIQKLHEQGVTLIITVDSGITGVAEVAFGNELGVDTIVTDHHLPLPAEASGEDGPFENLPAAVAVVNPHQAGCEYPFKELCGTGVAFKLVEALLLRLRQGFGGLPNTIGFGQEKWLLDLVALATVADMMPLVGENRTLVRYGLMVIQKGRRRGLKALLEKMRIPLSSVTEDDLSFSIAPKVNAASRMQSPRLAFELLTTSDPKHATELAATLVSLNDARKLEGARVAKEVKRRLEGQSLADVIVLGNSDWKPALLGIAATNVVETYQRTVCLWGKEGDLIKGSCRSDGSVNIVSLMSEAKDAFVEFGGHELSGGFSLKADAIHTLPLVLQETYQRVRTTVVVQTKDAAGSIPISASELTSTLYSGLRTLAPFGLGNPKPLFTLSKVRVERVLTFGAHKEHARVTISDDSGRTVEAVCFFTARTSFGDTLQLVAAGDTVSITGSFEQSFFANKKELRLRLEHLELAGI